MYLTEMIKHLQDLVDKGIAPTAIIKAYDPGTEEYEEITGFTFSSFEVILQTDVMNL